MRCHTGAFPNAPIINPVAHTFHKPDSPGSQCVNCHMPQTLYMQRHSRHDHGFTTPDPLLTKELNIPNACNRCHTDKDADWSLAAANQWYGDKMNRPARERTRAIAAARRGDESAAKPPLLALLADGKTSWYWKNVATGLLAHWAGEPDVLASLVQQLSHDHPQVRATAVHAVAPMAQQAPQLRSMLQRLAADDASRAVRVAAASELIRDALDPQSLAAREFVHFLDIQSDQPNGQLQKALLSTYRRDSEQAVAHLRKAVQYDSHSAALRREVAVLYGSLGMPHDALAQMQEACRLEPANADYQYLLGLSYNELGEKSQMMAALQRAVSLDPHHGRAWYNLALAHRDAGEPEPALNAFQHAEAADPADPDIPYARAMLLLQLNRRPDAIAALQRTLQLRPNDAAAVQLLRGLTQQQ
jgi:tetratricopeptide (TPR) repeat protein